MKLRVIHRYWADAENWPAFCACLQHFPQAGWFGVRAGEGRSRDFVRKMHLCGGRIMPERLGRNGRALRRQRPS